MSVSTITNGGLIRAGTVEVLKTFFCVIFLLLAGINISQAQNHLCVFGNGIHQIQTDTKNRHRYGRCQLMIEMSQLFYNRAELTTVYPTTWNTSNNRYESTDGQRPTPIRIPIGTAVIRLNYMYLNWQLLYLPAYDRTVFGNADVMETALVDFGSLKIKNWSGSEKYGAVTAAPIYVFDKAHHVVADEYDKDTQDRKVPAGHSGTSRRGSILRVTDHRYNRSNILVAYVTCYADCDINRDKQVSGWVDASQLNRVFPTRLVIGKPQDQYLIDTKFNLYKGCGETLQDAEERTQSLQGEIGGSAYGISLGLMLQDLQKSMRSIKHPENHKIDYLTIRIERPKYSNRLGIKGESDKKAINIIRVVTNCAGKSVNRRVLYRYRAQNNEISDLTPELELLDSYIRNSADVARLEKLFDSEVIEKKLSLLLLSNPAFQKPAFK